MKPSFVRMVCMVFLICIGTGLPAPAQSLRNLLRFDYADGADPVDVLVQGTDGNFYGTTSGGGSSKCVGGCGTVFKITSVGKLTTLHEFVFTDGAGPENGGLIEATDGNFYGTTYNGGNPTCSGGCGTVFKITPTGVLTTLHRFNSADGSNPNTALVQGSDANLYGTTSGGGSKTCDCGTVFKITVTGKLTTLHTFTSADGIDPDAGLVQGSDGNFYGTTFLGGVSTNRNCGGGCGTVFKMTPTGELTTLYNFDFIHGESPYSTLAQGADGNFYGTTYGGGNTRCFSGCGTVFKITPGGKLTTLHSFVFDGFNPNGLVFATDGNFYRTTALGTVFEVTAKGKLTGLFYLGGRIPYAGLVQGTDGNFYGTTGAGFNCSTHGADCGSIYRVSVGLGPFVETLPSVGKVGTKVTILGTNLTTATGATFNGTAAKLMTVTSSAITTIVPEGATTGTVVVTTPKTTLDSNVAFRVTK